MEFNKSEWQGFEALDFVLEGRECKLVIPKNPREDKKWIYKTEYFGAFPAFQIEMLERGYYLAYMKSTTRWCPKEDTDARAVFCEFLIKEFGLAKKCLPVGMSCGGMQAVYLGAKYPQYVSAMYLDAPVINLLSCPCGVGIAVKDLYPEFVEAMGITVSDLINYRNHPIDNVPSLIENKIPVFLVCGDSDKTVPYTENGKALAELYRQSDVPFFEIVKENCDHHPHGLDDNTPILDFAEKYYKV